METMNYNRVKKGSGVGLVMFVLVIVLGTMVVFYGMANEPETVILGQDALVEVYEEPVVDVVSDNVEELKYKVSNDTIKESKGNFKANITLPRISINDEFLLEINETIKSKFSDRYASLKNENATSLENKFTYKVTYKKYETELENGQKLISFTVYERIIDDSKGIDTMYNLYGYTINVNTKTILKQEDIAPIILGNNYQEKIRETVKDYIVSEKMLKEEDYTYSMTGLEEFYVKEGKLHIIFNTGEIVSRKYEHLDIII